MKGCPLRCKWCANPEGQRNHPELGFIDAKCVGAETCNARCIRACPAKAIGLSQQGKPMIDRRTCNNCGKCTEECYYGALKLIGQEMTIDEVLAEVEKDRPFYRRSSGGITLGGGEPLTQFEFVIQLLEKCQEQFLHTAIETSGFGPWPHLERVLEYVDLVYCDIKHMDPVIHKKLTSQPNDLILGNVRKILLTKKPDEVIIRIPIIPGCNNSEGNVSDSVRFAAELGCEKIELVPYHKLGISKYSQYGMEYKLKNIEPPTKEEMQRFRDIVERFGLKEMTGVL